jgi:hypothetical protein
VPKLNTASEQPIWTLWKKNILAVSGKSTSISLLWAGRSLFLYRPRLNYETVVRKNNLCINIPFY